MKWTWTIFSICFFHNFMLMKCESDYSNVSEDGYVPVGERSDQLEQDSEELEVGSNKDDDINDKEQSSEELARFKSGESNKDDDNNDREQSSEERFKYNLFKKSESNKDDDQGSEELERFKLKLFKKRESNKDDNQTFSILPFYYDQSSEDRFQYNLLKKSESSDNDDYDDDNDETYRGSKISQIEKKQYKLEKLAGDPADTFGTNQHHYYPTEYKDFGRRFVLQYPYKEVKNEVDAESVLDKVEKKSDKQPFTKEDLKLLPVKASPELVLQVAIKSAVEQADHPQNLLNTNEKNLLRSGDYWSSVWKEEIDPKRVLRTFEERTGYNVESETQDRMPKLNSLKVKVMPGSKLYQLVSVLKKSSPRLLYVINNKQIKD